MLEIAPAALSEIKRVQHSRQQLDSYLRLSVVEGGCVGYRYHFELCDRKKEGDYLLELDGLSVLIQSHQLDLIQSLRLDYAEDLMGGGFRFQNAGISNVCSCGLSFSLGTY